MVAYLALLVALLIRIGEAVVPTPFSLEQTLWPQLGGNAQHTGQSAFAPPQAADNVVLAWSLPVSLTLFCRRSMQLTLHGRTSVLAPRG